MATVYVAVDVKNLEQSAESYGEVVPLGAVIERAKAEGYPVVLRAYADWTEQQATERMAEYRAFGFELIQLLSDSRGKNTADMMLALDLQEALYHPNSPDVFVVVSGDGDFAPLASKIRRHAKQYLVMGFRDSSSAHLQRVADQFVFVEDIMRGYDARRQARSEPAPAPPETTLPREPEQQPMAEAAPMVAPAPRTALKAQTWKEDASPAPEDDGLLRIPGDAAPLDFSDPNKSARSYKRILEKMKYVRVQPYEYRKRLVERAWELFGERGRPISLQDLMDELLDYSEGNALGLYPKDVEKMLHTLFIGRCFDVEEYPVTGFQLAYSVYPAADVDVEMALDLMHQTYVRGLEMAMPAVPLNKEAVACFLMDEISAESLSAAERTLRRVRPDWDAPSPMQVAFDRAQQSQRPDTSQ